MVILRPYDAMNTADPLFCFVHASDLHYEAANNVQVPKANARIDCLIKDINNITRSERLRFVLFSGDLTNCGAANENELVKAKAVLDTLAVPYHAVTGNHDLAPNRKFADMYPGKEDFHDGHIDTSNYARVFGREHTMFSFQESGYHFVGASLRDEDPDGTLDWLEEKIAGIPEKGVIITHYGLYPPRTSGTLHSWGFARIGKILPRLRTMVDGAGRKIIAYLYGHNHINSVVDMNGTYHISGGGIQKGCTGYRLFKCYENSVESSFHLLSDPALHDFNYWGIDKPEQCFDETHSTVEEYHKGNDEEQSFTIFI